MEFFIKLLNNCFCSEIMDVIELNTIVDFIQNDSRSAYTVLFKKYANKIYHLALFYYHNKEDAEEVVQEVFLKIWIKRKAIKDPAAFPSLLYTTAKNMIYDSFKKQVHIKAYTEHLKLYSFHKQTQNTEETVIYNELETYYEDLLKRMPEKRREVFILSRKHGLTHQEIADQLNISIRTVEEHIHQSLKYLKKLIEERYQFILISILLLYFI
jgi:RNA polymerase sigma-70 factor (family 1)